MNFIFKERRIYLKQAPEFATKIIKRKFLPNKGRLYSKKGMNPFDYWYNKNSGIKEYLDSYFSANISLLEKHPVLMNDCVKMYSDGFVVEKTQVLTLLSCLKIFDFDL